MWIELNITFTSGEEELPEIKSWVNLSAATMININEVRAVLLGILPLGDIRVKRPEEIEAIRRYLDGQAKQA